ncbi:MAG TPA: aminotransferase class V-fold PLP-dependent enzyme [Thermomicrobiales bacterium]|nr:aminotransferase class V-fold PLP-dependent enzyme [Thermomicrobiales bacterium]
MAATTTATDLVAAPELESPETLKSFYLLDPDITFLNHGSFGACPRPVFEEYQAWQLELERQPVHFIGRRQEALLDAARARIGTYLNADPDSLSFVVNATSGLNVIARSIELKPGDEVLTTNLEYGALDMTWDYLCKKSGATYVVQEIPVPFTTPQAVVDALWEGVNEHTRAIFLSHITSATATILPVAEICARARKEGILTIIDGAHAPGQIDLDMEALGCDIYSGNFHKWLQSPKGSAFLYVRPEHHDWIESLTISWGWVRGNSFVSRNQQQGTRDVAAFLSVPAAIDFQEQHNWPAVRARAHQMLAMTRARMHEKLGTTPLYGGSADDDTTWYNQLGLITLPKLEDRGAFQNRLLNHYGIEIPVSGHNDDWYFVRVSVQGYVTQKDLDTLESALIAELS